MERTHDFTNSQPVENLILISSAVFCAGMAIALYFGFRPQFLFVLIAFGCLSYLAAHFLMESPQFCLYLQLLFIQIWDLNDGKLDPEGNGKSLGERMNRKSNFGKPFREELRIGERLENAIEELFECLLEKYVHTWYKSEISGDNAFLLELRHLIRDSSAKVGTKLASLDLDILVLDECLPLVLAHVERICSLATSAIGPDFGNRAQPLPLIELKVLEQWNDLHWAMRSRDHQQKYLRAVADLLLERFVDSSRVGGHSIDEERPLILSAEDAGSFFMQQQQQPKGWPSHSCRHLLRELLLSAVFMPLMDLVADPDSLNRIGLSLLSTNPSGAIDQEIAKFSDKNGLERDRSAGFLDRFVDLGMSHTPDSLLSLKLNDLAREPRLLQLFDQYLRDTNGPTHLLDCFLQTRDIHMRLQKLQKAAADASSVGGKEHIQRLNEVKSDAWQLYCSFMHESASSPIRFKDSVRRDFAQAVGHRSSDDGCSGELEDVRTTLKMLERATENVYTEIYQQLHFNHVIPFCQSESYLAYLCGAPPDVEEFIRGFSPDATRTHLRPAPDAIFSLTQFRSKLFHLITSSSASAPSTKPTFYTPSDENNCSPSPSSEAEKAEDFFEGRNLASSSTYPVDFDNGHFALVDLSRDLSKWRLSIEAVEARKESVSSKMYLVYVVRVERNDLEDEMGGLEDVDDGDDPFLLRRWTVGHRFEEFYSLEERIREVHGNSLRLDSLPDRTSTSALFRTRNGRSFMEAHRSHFERFLQQLIQQQLLKRSDILFTFLSVEEDSADYSESGLGGNGASSLISELNPLRAMRRVPSKLGSGDRGQYLKPFVLNVMANVLAPRNIYHPRYFPRNISQSISDDSYSRKQKRGAVSVCSDQRSSSSLSGAERALRSCPSNSGVPPKIALDNVPIQRRIRQASFDLSSRGLTTRIFRWQRNLFDSLLFMLFRLCQLSVWVESALTSLRSLFGHICHSFMRRRAERLILSWLSTEETVLFIVQSIHELVLLDGTASDPSCSKSPSQHCSSSSSPNLLPTQSQDSITPVTRIRHISPPFEVSEQEKQLRADLFLHCLKKAIGSLPSRVFVLNSILRQAYGTTDVSAEGDLERLVDRLFVCFQMPRLNKQLAFCLLDTIIRIL